MTTCARIALGACSRFSDTLLVILAAAAMACGGSGSPAAPSEGSVSGVLQGQTVTVTDGAAAANVTVQIGRERAVTSDANGMFQVDVGTPGSYSAVLSSNVIVERRTIVTGPSRSPVRLSLIPANFDLTAFDQMFRTSHSRLQRWTTRPQLVVVATVMNYRSGALDEYPATAEQMPDDEVAAMRAHLTEGVALLTGGTFTSFASVEVERPAEGTRVRVARSGSIVVGRYNGVVAWASTIGYGQWAEAADGSITGGSMFLDRDFDRDDQRRRLLRIHELGHALGYQHVKTRASIMNPSIGPEPNDFDRLGAIIAFQRPPGNHAPDADPEPKPTFGVVSEGGSRWAPPVICGPM